MPSDGQLIELVERARQCSSYALTDEGQKMEMEHPETVLGSVVGFIDLHLSSQSEIFPADRLGVRLPQAKFHFDDPLRADQTTVSESSTDG